MPILSQGNNDVVIRRLYTFQATFVALSSLISATYWSKCYFFLEEKSEANEFFDHLASRRQS